jgi:hypothetical protein
VPHTIPDFCAIKTDVDNNTGILLPARHLMPAMFGAVRTKLDELSDLGA